jgi:hypothetical protein
VRRLQRDRISAGGAAGAGPPNLPGAVQEMRRQGPRGVELLAFLEGRLHVLHRPAFAGGDHMHLGASAHEHVRAYVVVGGDDRQLGLGIPVDREVEVARPERSAIAIRRRAPRYGSRNGI